MGFKAMYSGHSVVFFFFNCIHAFYTKIFKPVFRTYKINTMKKVYLLFFASLLFIFKANAQLVVFADDYAPGVTFAAFGGSTNTLTVDNSQYHSGTASLKIPVTAGYTGGALVSAATNLSAYNTISFWAKNDNPAFKLDGVGIGNNATTTVYAVERNGVSLTSSWVKYYIPIPVASKLTAETGLFHFAEGSGEGAYNIWIDDIQYENVNPYVLGTPTAAFATKTITKAAGENFNPEGTVSTYPVCAEGAMQTARAYFTWTSSNTAVATIDATGAGIAVAQGTTNITGKLGSVTASGTLTVDVTAPLGDPTTAAPTPPARNAADVISLFSAAYTELAGTDWFPNWGQTTSVTDVTIAGDATKKYTNLNYQGVQFAAAINASGMTKLHIDVWTPNCTAFDVYPIVSGQPEQFVTLTPTLSGWNSFDIDLTKYTIPLSAIIQFKFVGTPFGSSTVYFDNLYFYTTGTVVTDPTTAAPTPNKNAAGVISLFSNAYTNVPVDTWSAGWDVAELSDIQIAGNDTKKYTGLSYAGVEFVSTTIDATTMDYYHVDIWTPDATTFGVKLVDFGPDGAYAGGDDTEFQLDFTPAKNGWVSYDIKLSDFTGLAARSHLGQMLFIGSASTLYVDNVYFYNTLLPISFTDFKVTRKNNTALLQWGTAFEQNNKGFSIERSADAVNWKQINFINGAVTASGARIYTATDLVPVNGVNYYRIKQVDFDGRTAYTSVQSLNFEGNTTLKLSLFPNPAKNKVTITLGTIESSTAHYSIVSANGKILKTGTFDKSLGNTVQTLDVSSLPRGLYMINLTDGSKQQATKLMLN